MVEWCRTQLARGRDTLALTQSGLVIALTTAGRSDEAITAAENLVETADATQNPYAISFALLAKGYALGQAHPDESLATLRRGLSIASESGNRTTANHLVLNLSRIESRHGDPLAALDYTSRALHSYHDAGSTNLATSALAILVCCLDRLGHDEAAATLAGFAFSPLTAVSIPEIADSMAHLREVLGDQAYEALSSNGASMATADIVAYAYDQIDQARAGLETQ